MSSTVHRSNMKSTVYATPQTLPHKPNRNYLMVIFVTTGGTIAIGAGGDPIPFGVAGTFEPAVVPTSEVSITTAGGTFIVVEG